MGFNLKALLGMAAPLVGGALGGPLGKALGGLVGNMVGGGHAQGNANGAAAQNSQVAQAMAGNYVKHAPSLTNALMTQSGINPETGAFDPNYNPTNALNDRLYGGQGIENRANLLYNPAQLGNEMASYKSAIAPSYDGAVGAARADTLNRGFAGNDTALDSSLAGIRRGEAGAQSGFNTNLLTNLYGQKRNYEVGQQQASQNLAATGVQDQQQNLHETNAALASGAQGASGTFGGLQGFYQGQATNAANDTAGAIGQIAKAGGFGTGGMFGNIFNRKQSTTPGTTNAQAPSPPPGGGPGLTQYGGYN